MSGSESFDFQESVSSSFNPSQKDLADVAAALQQAACTLLCLSAPAQRENTGDKESFPQEEMRTYRFSALALRCERELLQEHKARDLRELVFYACSSLTAFTALLELINPEAEVDGAVVHIWARELKRVEDLLFKIQDACSTVELVEARPEVLHGTGHEARC